MGWRVTLAAAMAVTAACTQSDAEPAADVASAAAEVEPPPSVPAEPSAQILRERRLLFDPAPLPSVQRRLGVAPVIMPPGSYRFDALGTPITLDVGDHWRLDSEHPGSFVITRPDAELEVLLPAVVFSRPVGLAHPGRAATESLHPGSTGWEPTDLGTWIGRMDQIVVLDSGRTTVDGVATRWWDVDVDPSRGPTMSSCQPGTCVAMYWSGGTQTFTVARDLERLRWYEIDDPQGPILVLVAATDADFGSLVEDVEELLAGATLGTSAPHPIESDVATATFMELAPNRRWRFAGLPGVTYESATTGGVEQRRGGIRLLWPVDGGGTEVLRPRFDATGRPLADAAAVVAAIEEHPGAVVRGASTILERPAVEIELTHRPEDDAVLRLTEVPNGFEPRDASWPERRHHRVWVLDGPTGPLVVGATSDTGPDLARAVARLDSVLDGLVLCATESCRDRR